MKERPENSEMRLVGVPVAKSDEVSKKWVQVRVEDQHMWRIQCQC
jgi:hypothetical protein